MEYAVSSWSHLQEMAPYRLVNSPFMDDRLSLIIPSASYALRLGPSLPKLFDQWLERSRVLPLTIRLFVIKPKSGEDYQAVHYLGSAIFDILKLHSERWENLDLNLPLAHFAEKFHAFSDLKKLRHLCLTPAIVNRDHPQLEPLFRKATPPTHLTLCCFYFPLDACNIALDNITHITLQSMASDQCLEAAQKAHRLEVFRLWTISSRDNEQMVYVINPAIRSLELAEGADESGLSFAEIMECMEITSLEEFEEFSYAVDPKQMHLASISSLLDRSSCRLKVLNLSGLRSYHIHDFGKLLEAMPSLEHLLLCCWEFDEEPMLDSIFKQLCDTSPSTAASSQLLPRLQMLDVRGRSVPFSWDLVPVIFYSSRWGSICMTFNFHHLDIVVEVVPQLFQLVNQGRKLRIYVQNGGQKFDYFQEQDLLQNLALDRCI